MQKSLKTGLFLLAVSLFMGLAVATAQAAISVDGTEKTITLTTNTYTLDDIWDDANVGNDNLTNYTDLGIGTGIWRANFSIIVESGTLLLNPNDGATGCTWLKLAVKNESGKGNSHINVTGQGKLYVNDTMITGWNNTGDCNLTWNGTFRPYIYVISSTDAGQPNVTFLNSMIGYLGWDRDNQYGIVYECGNISNVRCEPSGWMHNCTVMENFIGIDFQGVENMNVTNTWMNNTHEVGIVYTVDGDFAHGAHGGYIGDHPTWTNRASYTSVSIDYCSGDPTAMGIRLCNSDNITMNQVNIQDANTSGLWVESCDNLTANATTCYLNTNAASDCNIYLLNVTDSTFTNCTAYSPSGAANGGNWNLTGSGTCRNNFTKCLAYASDTYDFYIDEGVHNNYFTNCTINNSNMGFFCISDNNNTFVDCISHNHTYYDFKFYTSVYNDIVRGYANDSVIGVYILSLGDGDPSHHNRVTDMQINGHSSYAIRIGVADNLCHNNTIENVTVVGKANGDGIFIFGNCTNNYVGNSSATGCSGTGDGMGIEDYAHNNTFRICNSSKNGDAGFSITGHAYNNTVDNCTSHNNKDGIETNAPINYFCYCNITDNTGYGVSVTGSGVAVFHKCVAWNPSATYDWTFANATNVSVLGDYILGCSKGNNQTSASPYYGIVSHAPGNGAWNLDTKQMKVYTSASDYCVINLTGWTSTTYRRWIGASNSCTTLYQIIGGLSAGTKYNLLVDNNLWKTLTAYSSVVIPGEGATGCVGFDYSGSWSTHTFVIEPYEAPGPGGGPGPGTAADENDISVYVLTNGEDAIAGATIYIYENSVIVKTGTTDTGGIYNTTLDDGTYKFVANADGYREEYQVKAITGDTAVTFHLTTIGYCPACLAGPYLSLSVLGWILTAILIVIGFLAAYLIDSKQIKKDYLVILLAPNAILVILGIICHPILIIVGVACAIIQFLWAGREEL